MIRSASTTTVRVLGGICAAFVLLMPVAIIVDVLSRAIFANPLAAVFEGIEYSMLWIPLLGAPLSTLYNEHIVVDLIDGLFDRKHGEKVRAISQIVAAATSFVSVVVLAVMAWDSVINALEAGTRMTTTLAPPRWIIHSIIPVSMTITALVFAGLLVTAVGKLLVNRNKEASPPNEA